MSDTAPTPNDMPGANKTGEPETTTPESDTGAMTPEQDAPDVEAMQAEIEKLRARVREGRKHEDRAKRNHEDAERWRQLAKQFGEGETDLHAEFQKLRDEVNRERTERIRSEVARTEDVDPDVIFGDTEEQMRESAQRFKARVEAALEKALKGRSPAAAPASEVTSDSKIDGPKQLSRADLQNMSHKERIEAYKNGQLDALMREP